MERYVIGKKLSFDVANWPTPTDGILYTLKLEGIMIQGCNAGEISRSHRRNIIRLEDAE